MSLCLWIDAADAVVIGAGSGLSTAAGLSYSGKRFIRYFSDFIERYHMKDMYSAGFEPDRIFATQGDYGKFQCRKACHNKLYDNEAQIRGMVREQTNCRIPAHLVPKCPVCGGEMEVNLRCDDFLWRMRHGIGRPKDINAFWRRICGGNLLFLELGVGMNTPAIIKYPFWQMTYQNPNARYACINLDGGAVPGEIGERSVCIQGNIAAVLAVHCRNGTVTYWQDAIAHVLNFQWKSIWKR